MTGIYRNEDIQFYRLATLKAALTLEQKGMKRSRAPSAYSLIRHEFGLRGSKLRVLEQFECIIEQLQVEMGGDSHG